MLKKLEFVLHEEGKQLDKIELETSTDLSHLVKSIDEFRLIVNETLTKKIEDGGGLVEDCVEYDSNSNDEDEELVEDISPKKRKM